VDHLDIELAHRFLQGKLDAPLAERLQHHIDRCPRCRNLLANERSLMAMLDLGTGAESGAEYDVHRLLDGVDRLAPRGAGGVWRSRWFALAGAALILILGALLVWQATHMSPDDEAAARQLGITPELQDRVVRNLDALIVIEEDPWLTYDWEAVDALASLINSEGP
jgi:anti-sigma factor RsiW